MRTTLLRLAPLAGLLCFASAHAAGNSGARMMQVWTDVVVPAQTEAYEAGQKAFIKCLADHHFRYGLNAVTRLTGNNTFEYSFITQPVTWAELDTAYSAFMATGCASINRSQIYPHIQSESSGFLRMSPDLSYLPSGGIPHSGLYEVVSFTLKGGPKAYEEFTAGAKKIYAAANKYKWPHYSVLMEVDDAGAGAPDFILVAPHKNWADFAMTGPNVWKRLAQAYGKKEAAVIRHQLDDAIKNVTSHIDGYDADLTYTPSGN